MGAQGCLAAESVTVAVREARRGAVVAGCGGHAGENTCGDYAAYGIDRAEALIDELACHMRAAGEIDAAGKVRTADAGLEGSYVLEQKAKLVWMAGADAAYVVPSGQDWAHDALGDACVVPGVVYSDDEPFLEGEACVSGYFQADADGRWARVESGRAPLAGTSVAWRASLEEFPEVMAQLEECMGVSGYRHVAEQAALQALAGA